MVLGANLESPLLRYVTALLQLLNHAIEIGITSAKFSCKPISTALSNLLAVGNHLKLAGLARPVHGFNAEPLLDEGRETRDLGLVVVSGWTGNYLDFHSVLLFACRSGSNIPRNRMSTASYAARPATVHECNRSGMARDDELRTSDRCLGVALKGDLLSSPLPDLPFDLQDALFRS
jgi:hypothetical protein